MSELKVRISAQKKVKLGKILVPTVQDSASLIITVPIPKHELKAHFPYNYKVLMAKRISTGSFSNAHVFPGGKLDESDTNIMWQNHIDSSAETNKQNALIKFKVCAIRETFEETGFLAATKPPTNTHFPYNYKVLMAKRISTGSFSNAHVFPGGKLDESDTNIMWQNHIDSSTETNKQNALIKFKVCAIRETFEETGFLAATKPPTNSRMRDNQNTELLQECISSDSKLLTSRLNYFSRWITPEFAPRRFDAHFFMMNIQDIDTVMLDQINQKHNSSSSRTSMQVQDSELMYMEWKTPQEFIDGYYKKNIELATAQIYLLMQMKQFTDYKALEQYSKYHDKNNLVVPFISHYHLTLNPAIHVITFPGDYIYKQDVLAEADFVGDKPGEKFNRLFISKKKNGETIVSLKENIRHDEDVKYIDRNIFVEKRISDAKL
ncbi:hypothetical protein BB561_001708 [Smittium simulii]|uniref:Nudix hydrolase domain-containing protein n=1 Tax=Smittium simulii TaxID=133385 RepID=A0A2T9YTC3_9FUNG|nr:hypothetical protein BB561_001708 [Smittium simulii]